VGGKVKLKEVQDLAYTCRLDAQGIDRLVNSDRFEDLWKLLGDIDRGEGHELIGSGNLSKVRSWFESRKKEHPGTMSVKELRELAGDLGVKYYYSMNKEKLIAAIRRKQNG